MQNIKQMLYIFCIVYFRSGFSLCERKKEGRKEGRKEERKKERK